MEVSKTKLSALHSKMVIGDRSFIISSANLTYRSLYTNLEFGVYIDNKAQTHKIQNLAQKIIE